MSGGHLYHLEPLSSHLHRRAALQGSEYHVISKRSIRDMLNQNLMSTHNKGISNLFYKRDPGYKPTYIITLLHLENQHFHCSLFLSFRFLVITKALWISRGGSHYSPVFIYSKRVRAVNANLFKQIFLSIPGDRLLPPSPHHLCPCAVVSFLPTI